MARQTNKIDQFRAITIFSLPLLGAIAALLWNSFNTGRAFENMATKTDISEVYKAAKAYTDDRSAAVTKDAHDWSDANRQSMNIKITEIQGDLIAKQAAIGAKVDLVILTLQEMRVDERENRSKRK